MFSSLKKAELMHSWTPVAPLGDSTCFLIISNAASCCGVGFTEAPGEKSESPGLYEINLFSAAFLSASSASTEDGTVRFPVAVKRGMLLLEDGRSILFAASIIGLDAFLSLSIRRMVSPRDHCAGFSLRPACLSPSST